MNKKKLRSEYIKSIKALEFKKLDMRKFYTTRCYKNYFWKIPCAHPLDFAFERCQREFNEVILKTIRKHPVNLSDEWINKLEKDLEQITEKLPQTEEVTSPYWYKFAETIDLCYNYNKNKEIKT